MIVFACQNGLGDRILDIIGVVIFAQFYKQHYHIALNFLNQHAHGWQTPLGGTGFYDSRLIQWGDLHVPYNQKPKPILPDGRKVLIPDHSMTLSPLSLVRYTNIPIEQILKQFKQFAVKIRPSAMIQNCLPSQLFNCYGIHLRKTDKVSHSNTHQCNRLEFDNIIAKLQEYISNKLKEEQDASFFIASEDIQWKTYFTQWVQSQGGKIIELNIDAQVASKHPGFYAIADLFALSKCKEIIQGVKHSSFSLTAALINPNGKLINFAPPEDTLLQYWTYIVNTNHPLQPIQTLFQKISNYKPLGIL